MGDTNMQTSTENLEDTVLEDPNFDGRLNEIVGNELSEVTIDEDAQRQSEIDRAAERKRKRALAQEHERREKEIAQERERREKEIEIERKLEEQAYAYVPPKYDLSHEAEKGPKCESER